MSILFCLGEIKSSKKKCRTFFLAVPKFPTGLRDFLKIINHPVSQLTKQFKKKNKQKKKFEGERGKINRKDSVDFPPNGKGSVFYKRQ